MISRPLPKIDEDNRRYFSPKKAVLEVQRCMACNSWNFYPRTHCRKCLSRELEWRAVSPTGIVYSFTVVHRPQHEFFLEGSPHIMIVAEMDDGFQMIASLEHDPERIPRIGDRVEATRQIIEPDEGLSIPTFKFLD